MLLFKAIHCDDIYVRHNDSPMLLTTFLSSVTFDSILLQHHNAILCSLTSSSPASSPPIVYFTNNRDSIYSLTFTSSVIIKHLPFSTTSSSDVTPYINYLISDNNRNWITINTLTHDTPSDDTVLSNQMLTLLRICHINKDDYIKNPDILARKFVAK
jgi:hypothetical protein